MKMEQIPENKKQIDTQKYIETSKKDFKNVLNRILLSKVPFTKEEMEFQFDLPWEELKLLLDKHAEYKVQKDGQVVISDVKSEPETVLGNEKPEELRLREGDFKKIGLFFYKRKRNRRWMPIAEFTDKELLARALSAGIVWPEGDQLILFGGIKFNHKH